MANLLARPQQPILILAMTYVALAANAFLCPQFYSYNLGAVIVLVIAGMYLWLRFDSQNLTFAGILLVGYIPFLLASGNGKIADVVIVHAFLVLFASLFVRLTEELDDAPLTIAFTTVQFILNRHRVAVVSIIAAVVGAMLVIFHTPPVVLWGAGSLAYLCTLVLVQNFMAKPEFSAGVARQS